MAKQKYALNPGEKIVYKTSCVRHGFWGAYTHALTITNQSVMAKPNLAEKDILNPSEAIEYFVLSRRKFYDLLNNTDGEDFLAYYGERKLIIRVAFEKYLLHHPELRRRA